MLMDLPDDCEVYQELLSTPYHELSLEQQSELEHHLLNCSACALYKVESDLLCSLLGMLPVPDMEPGLPPQLEELIQGSREDVAEKSAARDPQLLKASAQMLTESQQNAVQNLHALKPEIYQHEQRMYLSREVPSGMMSCNNCRASTPDKARFCPVCGQDLRAESKIGTLLSDYEKIPTQPLFAPNDNNQATPASSGTATLLFNHETQIPTQPLVTRNKRPFISPTQAPPLQADFTGTPETPPALADLTLDSNKILTDSPTKPAETPSDFLLDQAPKPALKNAQTSQDNGGYQQTNVEHGAHQQAYFQRGTHQQPLAAYHGHQQAHFQHGSHQQAQVVHRVHQQAHGVRASHLVQHRKHVRRLTLFKGWQPSYLTVSISSVVVIVSLVVTVALGLLRLFHSEAANPIITMPSIVDLGQTAPLKGSNFAPHSQIFIAIDTQPSIAKPSLIADTQSVQGYMTLTVVDDGTIQTSLYIDTGWLPGSRHMLYALGPDGTLLVSKEFFVRNTLSAPTLVLCSNSKVNNSSASVSLGPAVEGDSKAVTTFFNLCTQGSGNVDWTSSWDTQNNLWLHVDQSGHIQAPNIQKLQISASAAALNAGTYTATVTFNTIPSQGNAGTIQLQVTLQVQKNNNTCPKTSVQTLTFTSTLGQPVPSPQAVTLLNCANKEDWSASVTTTDGSGWLVVSPSSGNLESGASNNLTVSVNPVNLAVGTYSGFITLGSSPNQVQIKVTYVVQEPPPPCISVNPTSLSFTAKQGDNVGPQSFTVSNCGGTGTITTSVSTDNGGSWLAADGGGILNAASQLGINVSVNTQGLSKGTYTGFVNVTLKDTNGAIDSKRISIHLTVS
jgi:hypothetical protein